MNNVMYILPGQSSPPSTLKTKGDNKGFYISQTIDGEERLISIDYLGAVKIFEDIKTWLCSDQAG